MPNDRKTPRVPRLSDEARDEYPRKTPPAGVQAAIEEGAPLHEIGFEKTDMNNVLELAQKSYERTKEQSGMLKVHAARLDGIEGNVGLIADETRLQTGILNTIVSSHFQIATHREVSDITIKQVRATTEIEDAADARQKRRLLVAKIVGAIAGAVASGGALALLAQRGCG